MKWLWAAAAAVAIAAGAAAGVVLRALDGVERPAFRGNSPPGGFIAPSFALRDQDGRLVRMDALRGKAVAVTFLDSQCDEACPIIARQIADAWRLLDTEERQLMAAIAISTDPAEDTPASIRSFLGRVGAESALRYLDGSLADLRPVWRAFMVLPSVESGDDEVHSAPVRIFDTDGEWVSTLHPGVDLTPANLVNDLRAALID